MSPGPLSGRICLVAGASRGVGRGLARALGEAGATVVVTARSSEAGPRTDGRSETVEDAAREVSTAGGQGHPYRCDHVNEREVDALVAWTLRRFGRIDVAASAVWGGNEGFDGTRFPDGSAWGDPFWRRSVAGFGRVMESGAYAALLLARAVAPGMAAMRSGLIALVSFPTDAYLGDIHYDLAKASVNRLAFACAEELRPYGVTALALAPGQVATERALDAGLAGPDAETPLYVGRALAALAADPDAARWSGEVVSAADLAEVYGFTDADGRRPGRYRP